MIRLLRRSGPHATGPARKSDARQDYAGGRESFGEWAERWFSTAAATSKASTVRGYRSILDSAVLPAFGTQRIRSITPADVQEWINQLSRRGLAPPTIRHRHLVARWVFAEAARGRAIDHNPAADVKLPTDRSVGRHKPEPRFLTAEEVERLAAVLDRSSEAASPYGLLVRFVAYTGLRAGEVAGLNVGDIDLRRRVVHVRRTRERVRGAWLTSTPKSGMSRSVPLVGWLAADLAAYLQAHPRGSEPDAPLWPGARPGGYTHGQRGSQRPGSRASGTVDYDVPWEPGTFYRRRYQPALAAAGLPSGRGGVRFHDLRHTFASLCASAGISSQQVARWMGHANDTVTRVIYTHLFEQDTVAAVEALEVATRRSASFASDRVQPRPSASASTDGALLAPSGGGGMAEEHSPQAAELRKREWGGWGSNPRPRDYESPALTC
jgi:integrase